MRNLLKTIAIAMIVSVSFNASAEAQEPNIIFGINNEVNLLADTANQRVDFFSDGLAGQDFDTFELFILIGDGGAAAGGQDTAPGLMDVELGIPGTLFDGGNRGGGLESSQTPLLWADLIDSVQIASDGQLGTLIFDTTGADVGDVVGIQFGGFSLDGTTFDSSFSNLATSRNVGTASSGFISIVGVPEPSSAFLLLGIAGVAGLRRRR